MNLHQEEITISRGLISQKLYMCILYIKLFIWRRNIDNHRWFYEVPDLKKKEKEEGGKKMERDYRKTTSVHFFFSLFFLLLHLFLLPILPPSLSPPFGQGIGVLEGKGEEGGVSDPAIVWILGQVATMPCWPARIKLKENGIILKERISYLSLGPVLTLMASEGRDFYTLWDMGSLKIYVF